MYPKVSVLIPVYNAEKYLPGCLKSVSAQTFTDIEIICINDGSTDQSAIYLETYSRQEPRLRVIHQPNAGVAATRNRLLKEAHGKYIAFVDADDWIKPGYLQKLYEAAVLTDADIVRGLFEEYNEKKNSYTLCDKRYRDYAAKRGVPHTPKERFIAGIDDSQVWGKLIKLDFIRTQQIGFATGAVAEDVSFEILLYLCAPKILFVQEYDYCYRTGVSGSITTNKLAMAEGILLNLCFLSEELPRRGFDLPEIYSMLLRLMAKGIKRFYRLNMTERDFFLCQRAVCLIEKHQVRCYCLSRWKYKFFVYCSRHLPMNRFIQISRFFH